MLNAWWHMTNVCRRLLLGLLDSYNAGIGACRRVFDAGRPSSVVGQGNSAPLRRN